MSRLSPGNAPAGVGRPQGRQILVRPVAGGFLRAIQALAIMFDKRLWFLSGPCATFSSIRILGSFLSILASCYPNAGRGSITHDSRTLWNVGGIDLFTLCLHASPFSLQSLSMLCVASFPLCLISHLVASAFLTKCLGRTSQ